VRIVVPLKTVPDLVEEIELTADETGIEREYLKFVLNEWDAQALEEALLLKDAGGAEVVAVGAADDPEIDQTLYTALAKGADAAVRLADASAGSPGPAGTSVAARAALLAGYLEAEPADLVITGVQAADDPDGQLPPTLATLLDLPHVSVVVSVEAADGSVTVRQEFAAGLSHELQVQMPAVIGVQSARQVPRYAPITRIRQAMQTGGLTERAVTPRAPRGGLVLRRMHRPARSGRAEMLAGSPGDVAGQIVELLRARGLVKGRATP
jgi:electron transfer flavoprotein beta subunit